MREEERVKEIGRTERGREMERNRERERGTREKVKGESGGKKRLTSIAQSPQEVL